MTKLPWMRWFVLLFLFAGVSAVVLTSCQSPYNGPKSDNFDSGYFRNSNPQSKTFLDFIKLAWNSPGTPWPEFNPVIFTKPKAQRVNEGIRYTFINHSTFLIQTAGLNILTDPIYSERASPVSFAGPKRYSKPAVKFEDLPEIDLVLISHDHYDHLDAETIERLVARPQKKQPYFVVGLGLGPLMRDLGVKRFREMDWNQSLKIGDVDVWFVECQHRSGRGIFDQKKTLWGSFVVQSPSGRVYFAGDTGYSEHFKKQGFQFKSFQLALLPIGAYEPRWFMQYVHTNPEEAVLAHKDLNSEYSVGIHFGTFKLTYEGINEPMDDLEAAKKKHGVTAFIAPKQGDSELILPAEDFKPTERIYGKDDPKLYLGETELFDTKHKGIAKLLANLSQGLENRRQIAVAIHDYVRDQIAFGWREDFGLYKGSEVLASKVGFCHSKTTLFVTMMRAAGIPARPLFAEINVDILDGLDIPGPYVDHSYAEVYLNQTWISLDSYIIPERMARRAKIKLKAAGKPMGLGVALEGESQWTGERPAFIQFIDSDKVRAAEFPLYADIGQFYEYAQGSHNNGFFQRLIFPYTIDTLNEKLRPLQQDRLSQRSD
ncbi:MAG: MBL fold metallo-hydrolase [Pseudobacteriovorax sp.]|nr:MBL fold metallo-hydrolase [Pseudobacteriovorax sp.]